MKISLLVGAALIASSTTALAGRPAVYPLRSQSAATQSVDNAYCYWQAKQQTGVDMTRQSQRPLPATTRRTVADAGRGASEPPLPAPHGASAGASLGAANGGSSAVQAGNPAVASTQSMSANPTASSSVSSGTIRAQPPNPKASGTGSAAVANLPPLPPPEPPMATYWRAYGDCMQSRGYGVQ